MIGGGGAVGGGGVGVSVSGGGGVTGSTTVAAASRHNANKKRPISPEQVLRLFGTTTSSSSAPSNYNYSNGSGVTRDRGRRSPASSPPSTTHQVNKVSTDSFHSFPFLFVYKISTLTVNDSICIV